jgi:hypothetical protein
MHGHYNVSSKIHFFTACGCALFPGIMILIRTSKRLQVHEVCWMRRQKLVYYWTVMLEKQCAGLSAAPFL